MLKKCCLIIFLILYLVKVVLSQVCINGDCKNGVGTYLFENNDKYSGSFKEGIPHGEGSIIYYSDSSIYSGTWVEGKKQGKGVFKLKKNGVLKATYEGFFENNKMHTKHGETAKFVTADFLYEGQFTNNLRTGKGKITYLKTGNRYEGDLINGIPEGKGTMHYQGIGEYTGNFTDGKPNGKGTLIFIIGDTYEGEWKDGKMHGVGKYTFKSGKTYEGIWEDGVKK